VRPDIKSDASSKRPISEDDAGAVKVDDNQRFEVAAGVRPEPPPVSPLFHWTRETWGLALRAVPLEAEAQHLFTSAQLRLPAQADAAQRARAWAAVAGSLGTTPDRVLRVRQVHGRIVRVVRASDGPPDPTALPDGDAIVSNVTGAVLAVVVADCVPLLLVDPRRGAAAAVHAGWRGTCASVAPAAVEAMVEAWGTRPADLIAAIGPSIGATDYPVGESLVDAFAQAGHGRSIDRWFSRSGGELRLDLWRASADQLEAAGVRASRIAVAGISTAAHPGWLESYRRDGSGAGRLVAAVAVPPPRA
jgi:YfiH family protein